MAYVKVNKEALDGAITSMADTIRSQTKKSNPISWDQTTGLSNSINTACEVTREEGRKEVEDKVEVLNKELEQTLYGTNTGGKSYYDEFWDVFQDYGKRTQYMYGFAYGWINESTYNPKYPITPSGNIGLNYAFFWNTSVTDTKVPITVTGQCIQAFGQAQKLKRIPKLIFDGATNIGDMFLNCYDLEELNCEGELAVNGLNLQHSTKLNKASIESVINTLSITTSGLTATLSLTAINREFETSEGANDGEKSAEWLALKNTRSNWTVSLL